MTSSMKRTNSPRIAPPEVLQTQMTLGFDPEGAPPPVEQNGTGPTFPGRRARTPGQKQQGTVDRERAAGQRGPRDASPPARRMGRREALSDARSGGGAAPVAVASPPGYA